MLPESPLFKDEYQTKWTQYDPDLANQLLDGLGLTERDADGIRLLPDGRPLQIVVETAGEETEQTDVLELIRDHWNEDRRLALHQAVAARGLLQPHQCRRDADVGLVGPGERAC